MANTHSDFYIAIETVFKSWTALQVGWSSYEELGYSLFLVVTFCDLSVLCAWFWIYKQLIQGFVAFLQLAVAHSFGGAQSRVKEEWFVGATEQWFNENSEYLVLMTYLLHLQFLHQVEKTLQSLLLCGVFLVREFTVNFLVFSISDILLLQYNF